MDNDNTQTGAERSAEEVAWDEEFSTPSKNTADSIGATLADLGQLLVQVPAAIISMSNVMFPEETRRHARAAARESFLTVRSLLGAVGDGIEDLLAESGEGDHKPQKATVSGPAGTWGTTKAGGGTSGSTAGNKSRRIEISDTEAGATTSDSGSGAAQQPSSADDSDLPEDRGLRADIDY